MTGYGVSASLIGQPDIGLLTMTEMAAQAARIVAAVDIPVIADADNGYGGALNVMRTVREYERAGVAAIQLEDQVLPKRCGHMEGKQLVTKAEMVSKLKAAVQARRSDDFLIIARTDARAVTGFDDAMDRAKAYASAGADIIFFEAPQSVEEMKTVAGTLSKPVMANMVEHGKTPLLTGKELEALGYKLVIYPNSLLYTTTKAVRSMLDSMKDADTTQGFGDRMVNFPEFNNMIGLDTIRKMEESFISE